MENRLLMKFLLAACLAGTLLLTGCATGTGPDRISVPPAATPTYLDRPA